MNRVTSFIAEYLCSAARASGQYLGSILKFSSTCFWIQEPAGLDDSLEDLFFGAAGAIFFLVDSQFPVGVSVHPESLPGILSRRFRSLVGSARNLRPTQEFVLSESPKIER
jgi:hypothetical protein